MSQRAWRRVVPSALLNEGRVEVEGSPNQRLPSGVVYVSPTTGRSYDGDRGDTLASLPADAIEIRKQGFGLRIEGEGLLPSPRFSKWYETGQGMQRLKREVELMQAYFPDFDLCVDENNSDMAWRGQIKGIGEIEIVYPRDYPNRRFFINILGKEDENFRLNLIVSQAGDITPVAALIIAMRFFLEERRER